MGLCPSAGLGPPRGGSPFSSPPCHMPLSMPSRTRELGEAGFGFLSSQWLPSCLGLTRGSVDRVSHGVLSLAESRCPICVLHLPIHVTHKAAVGPNARPTGWATGGCRGWQPGVLVLASAFWSVPEEPLPLPARGESQWGRHTGWRTCQATAQSLCLHLAGTPEAESCWCPALSGFVSLLPS